MYWEGRELRNHWTNLQKKLAAKAREVTWGQLGPSLGSRFPLHDEASGLTLSHADPFLFAEELGTQDHAHIHSRSRLLLLTPPGA